jgi:hypothetical protein
MARFTIPTNFLMIRSTKTWHPGALITSVWASRENSPRCLQDVLAESTICWSKTGHLGVRFESISDEHKSELQAWLSQKLEQTLPAFVADQFQKWDKNTLQYAVRVGYEQEK